MKQILMIGALALSGSMSASASSTLEIENFRVGYACTNQPGAPEGQSPIQRICFETETIHVTGQGKCVYTGEEKQCTWYGFEIDYANADEGDKIKCLSTTSEPVNYGNPDAIEKEDVTTTEYALELDAGSGHFFNPQYSAFFSLSRITNEPLVTKQFVSPAEKNCSGFAFILYIRNWTRNGPHEFGN